jgi:hypothetical protein
LLRSLRIVIFGSCKYNVLLRKLRRSAGARRRYPVAVEKVEQHWMNIGACISNDISFDMVHDANLPGSTVEPGAAATLGITGSLCKIEEVSSSSIQTD